MIREQTTTLIMTLKNSIITIYGIIIAFLMPIIPLIIIVGVAIVLDAIISIRKSKKLKQPITSRKLSKSISKMVLYNSAVILFFCIEHWILGDFIGLLTSIPFVLTKLVTAFLLYVEGLSIQENLKAMGIDIWSKFKGFLKRSQELKDDITNITKKD